MWPLCHMQILLFGKRLDVSTIIKYVDGNLNFTVDCNAAYGSVKFRVRAVATHGTADNIVVYIKITSVNINETFTPLNNTGNDTTIDKFQPMTNDWDLYVGNLASYDSALIAIKALQNGNVGIGTATPTEKLSVNGKIRAKEIKVEATGWPDYVFEEDYKITSLSELENFIKKHKHLPEVPSAKEVEQNGVELGEMNKLLLKKIEELTLMLIEKDKELKNERSINEQQAKDINKLYELIKKK